MNIATSATVLRRLACSSCRKVSRSSPISFTENKATAHPSVRTDLTLRIKNDRRRVVRSSERIVRNHYAVHFIYIAYGLRGNADTRHVVTSTGKWTRDALLKV